MKYTYEEENLKRNLETYEWDDIWWEHAPDKEKPRMLVIGDSISCGYRRLVTAEMEEKLYVDGLATSKAIDNPSFKSLIDYVSSQHENIKIVQFNNGLHGWHLSDDEYAEFYEKMIDIILACYNDAKIVIALTTPVRDKSDLNNLDDRNKRVLRRNEIALSIAKEKDIPVNDLYSLICDKPHLWTADGVHLKEDGYRIIAKHTANLVKNI